MRQLLDQARNYHAHVPWMMLFFCLTLLMYVLAYFSSIFVPGHSGSLGWWGWWDQSQYLRSADALARGNLDPSEHWYPLGYSMLGAILFRWVPLHAFFVPNLLCLLAFGVSLVHMAKALGLARVWGAVAFFAGAVLPSLILEQYVIPWNTIPLAAAYGWIMLLYLLCMRDGFTRGRMVGLALLFVAVIAVRPTDVMPLVPLAVHLAIGLVRAWQTGDRRAVLSVAVWGGATALAGLAAYAALHVAIYGWSASPYMKVAKTLGFDFRSIPYKYALIFGEPREFYGSGLGIFARYPIAVLGLFGVIYALLFGRNTRTLALVVVASIGLYLAFTDFHPGNVWRYKLIHYIAWTLPVTFLLAFVAVSEAATRRRWSSAVIALVLATLLATVSLRARGEAPPVQVTVRGDMLSLQFAEPASLLAYRIDGVRKSNGRASPPLYAKALADGVTWSSVSDYRVSDVEGSTFVLFNRPQRLTRFDLPIEPGADATGATAVALVPRLALRLPRRRLEEGTTVARMPSPGEQQAVIQRCPGEHARPNAHPALDSDYLRAVYRSVLGREPDASGFEGGCQLLVSGAVTRAQLLRSMMDSEEFHARESQGP